MTLELLKGLGLPVAKVPAVKWGRRYRIVKAGAPAATGTLLLAATGKVGGPGRAWFELDGTGERVWVPVDWLAEI